MGRQIAMALVLIGCIAALLAIDGLPWRAMRGPAATAATAAVSIPPALTVRPDNSRDSDAMAVLTRQVLAGLRGSTPDTGALVQRLARRAAATGSALPTDVRPLTEVEPLAALPAADAPAAQVSPIMPRQRPAGTPRSHVIRPGDTLTTIAEAAYGRAGDWQRIYAANRDRLSRPDLLPPGTRLVLP